MNSPDLENVIASLRIELERIQDQCSNALKAIEQSKLYRLSGFTVPDVRSQRLIQEIEILMRQESHE